MQDEGQNPTSSYRSIFKATSLFGGVQVYQIVIGILRSKFIALLLGPTGMGIQGLYQSAIDMIKNLTSLGLEQSAVRDVSEANNSNDSLRVARTIGVVQRLVWITGLLGLLVTLFLSPTLSTITFGNTDYTWGFALLSITLLLNQICSGQKVVLQGLRHLKYLAKSSAIGATIGLVLSIPLYYWMGLKSIVPTMIITSFISLALTWYYSNKLNIKNEIVGIKESFNEGKSMMRMGFALSVSGILVTLSAYILRWFIRQDSGIDEVGLFSAGFMISNTYVGMIFNAMATDYYPRLAAVNKNNKQCSDLINRQAEIAVLIISPLIISCIILPIA